MNEIVGEPSLQTLLDAVAARTTAPGGGVATGVVAALAAALTGMCARFSNGNQADQADQAGLADIAGRADELRVKAALLARSDPVVYAAYVRARRAGGSDDIAAALDEAIRIPLEMAEVSAELADLALGLARSGNPNLRGDATAAVFMGAAAARAGAALVCENLAGSGGDPRLGRAAAVVASVRAAERDVLSLYPALSAP